MCIYYSKIDLQEIAIIAEIATPLGVLIYRWTPFITPNFAVTTEFWGTLTISPLNFVIFISHYLSCPTTIKSPF